MESIHVRDKIYVFICMPNSAILVIHPKIGSSLFDSKMNFMRHFCKRYFNKSTSTENLFRYLF